MSATLQASPFRVSTNTFYGPAQTDGERTVAGILTARLEHRFDETATLRNTFRVAGYSREVSATAPRPVQATVAKGNTDASRITRQPQVRSGYDSQVVNLTEAILAFDIKTVADTAAVFAADRIRMGEKFGLVFGGR